jgi:hypothetical protein
MANIWYEFRLSYSLVIVSKCQGVFNNIIELISTLISKHSEVVCNKQYAFRI